MNSTAQPQKPSVEEPDFEVITPGGEEDKVKTEAIMRVVAMIMDNLFKIPGTRIRIGLDPVLGLIPGFGDASSAFVSVMTLFGASQQGIPRIVLARMALNILLNALGGAIPVFGDFFSAFFKSNQRNYDLLLKHQKVAAGVKTTKGDWFFVVGLISALGIALVLIGVGAAFLLYYTFMMIRWMLGY